LKVASEEDFLSFVFFVKSLEEVKSKGEQKNGVEKVENFCLLSLSQ